MTVLDEIKEILLDTDTKGEYAIYKKAVAYDKIEELVLNDLEHQIMRRARAALRKEPELEETSLPPPKPRPKPTIKRRRTM